MRTFTRWWFVLFCAVALLNRYYIRPSGNTFIDGYLNDFLAMPILFQLCKGTMRMLYKDSEKELNTPQLVVGFITVSFFFEVLFPQFNPKASADLGDVLAYAAGTICFFYIQKLESAQI
jgi:hypothetical protein